MPDRDPKTQKITTTHGKIGHAHHGQIHYTQSDIDISKRYAGTDNNNEQLIELIFEGNLPANQFELKIQLPESRLREEFCDPD